MAQKGQQALICGLKDDDFSSPALLSVRLKITSRVEKYASQYFAVRSLQVGIIVNSKGFNRALFTQINESVARLSFRSTAIKEEFNSK